MILILKLMMKIFTIQLKDMNIQHMNQLKSITFQFQDHQAQKDLQETMAHKVQREMMEKTDMMENKAQKDLREIKEKLDPLDLEDTEEREDQEDQKVRMGLKEIKEIKEKLDQQDQKVQWEKMDHQAHTVNRDLRVRLALKDLKE